jgi:superfamily I DNA/RNA helicase
MAFTWSPQQQAFLDWCESGAGSAVVVAVAGAGKTTVAIEGIKRLRGQTAMMAFNKRIAEEIKVKLEKAGMDWKRAQGGTAHSFGFSAFRKSFGSPEIQQDKVRNIIEARAKALEQEHNNGESFVTQFGNVIAKLVGYAKQAALGVSGSIDDRSAWLRLIEHYDVWCDADPNFNLPSNPDATLVTYAIDILGRSNNDTATIDFDDMIYLPLLLKAKFWQFDNVVVDEAQDTNAARRILARVMLKRGGRLIAIGDPAQAINGFAGADNDALELIKRDFACIELPLTVSYRCPRQVVKFAQNWATHIQPHDAAPEGSVTYANVEDIFNGKLTLGGSDAILCRNNKPLVSLAMKLIKNRIGARIEGRDIGVNLLKLAHRWSRVNDLDTLRDRLGVYLDEQKTRLLAKKQEARYAQLEDQVECLLVIIEQCIA